MDKISRNDLCWCGSGKKYKKCHIELGDAVQNMVSEGYTAPPLSILKKPKDIEGIKKSCQLTKTILDQLNDIIKPGITTNEINTWVHEYTLDHGATPAPLNYKGFPKSICTSVNEVVCHGIPEKRVLKEGDIINVDVTCILDGYYGDSCRMYNVGNISKEAQALVDYTKECLFIGIEQVKPLVSVNDIGRAIHAHAMKKGYGVVDIFGGHGVGLAFHEEPFVFHCSRADKGMILVPNMIFTIEPMINQGTHKVEILDDEWTAVTQDGLLSAQWEHTVLVTENSVEILT